ncbi:hypothetical protein [Spirosoma flavum]|uniref:Uncharacterized protein n=1 Tax=Spirosoma flavum TaxID=2048557 RepID=A0ABW6AQY4_9BACT
MFDYIADFGFKPPLSYSPDHQEYDEVKFGPQNNNKKVMWTVLIYLLLALGLFARPLVVSFNNVGVGLKLTTLRWDVLITSLIVALAMLSPVLKAISRVQRGQLSWQHCLTAFSIGFFSDITFKFILDHFSTLFK